MTKMVMIVYNEALDEDLMEALGSIGLKNYTKVLGVFGKGTSSGTHLGNDVWPGRNNILYIACEEDQSKELVARVKVLRQKMGHEGIKAFVLPIEYLT